MGYLGGCALFTSCSSFVHSALAGFTLLSHAESHTSCLLFVLRRFGWSVLAARVCQLYPKASLRVSIQRDYAMLMPLELAAAAYWRIAIDELTGVAVVLRSVLCVSFTQELVSFFFTTYANWPWGTTPVAVGELHSVPMSLPAGFNRAARVALPFPALGPVVVWLLRLWRALPSSQLSSLSVQPRFHACC
jgi:hypothetical protein